ncbi:MAG: CCA tRNA nucleotidyltransferase [Chloroflexi bacterium]|nr:CCA tRNA nucleotidyltransferase [Chloroflexota bacterium]
MSNIANILEAQLDTISLRQLSAIGAVAYSHGVEAYLVGGAVRDALLGLPVHDIDITVVRLTSFIAQNMADALGGVVVARSQFNTFAVEESGRRLDLAMARQETYQQPGALPTVSPGTLRQELERRDFAVNAMAVSLDAESWGELHDPLHGMDDLRDGVIRVLRDDSFADDATRILRAARYAVRLGFRLDANTEQLAMRDTAYIGTISGARLRDEFLRTLRENRVVSILEMLHSLGALQAINRGITLDASTLEALRRAAAGDYADKPALLLSILAYDLAVADKAAFIQRLRLPSRLAQIMTDTGLAKSRLRHDSSIDVFSRSEIYARLNTLHETAILGCSLREENGIVGRRLTLYQDELRHIKPVLNGDDLVALGVPQGPRIGELLHDLLEARLDGQVKTRQDEIDFIQSCLSCPTYPSC